MAIFNKNNRKITLKDTTLFYLQLSILYKAKIPLLLCCDLLLETLNSPICKTIPQIKTELIAGKSFASALAKFPQCFRSSTFRLIHIGEQTGQLESVLINIAKQFEKQLAFSQKVKQALFYPCLILITALIMLLVMFLFVIPQFAILFADLKQQLPLFSVVLFYIATRCQQHILLITLLICGGLFLIYKYRHQINQTNFMHCLIEKFPGYKSYYIKMKLILFIQQLSLLLKSGVQIIDSVQLAAESTEYPALMQAAYKINQKISAGLPLYYCMALMPIFPTNMLKMIKLGEESGNLEEMLDQISHFFEHDVEATLSYLTKLLEPLIMLVLGVLIGGLIIGLYLPIFKLGNTL